MKNFTRLFAIAAISLSLSSCSTMNNLFKSKQETPLDYIKGGTELKIKNFFDGEIEAFAIKQDSSGKIISTFTAKIKGEWEGNKGVVKHNFIYANGSKDSRTWLITIDDSDGSFTAVGHDVATPANGKQIGNAAQSNYSLRIGSKAQKEIMNFEDRMYLVDDKSMIMISEFNNHKNKSSSGKIIYSLKKLIAE
jgi:hypothetical protein